MGEGLLWHLIFCPPPAVGFKYIIRVPVRDHLDIDGAKKLVIFSLS
jgi:hypothetical protein